MGRVKLSKVVVFRLPLEWFEVLNRMENKSAFLRQTVIEALTKVKEEYDIIK